MQAAKRHRAAAAWVVLRAPQGNGRGWTGGTRGDAGSPLVGSCRGEGGVWGEGERGREEVGEEGETFFHINIMKIILALFIIAQKVELIQTSLLR